MQIHLKCLFLTVVVLTICACSHTAKENPSHYVDPLIGSAGGGNVVIGPCAPFGVVRPSPDCKPRRNAGWAEIPEAVRGFSQTHVSGTGGAPKYGNVLLMPFTDDMSSDTHEALRRRERVELGYYRTEFEDSDIVTEITASSNAVYYRFSYPQGTMRGLCIDAGHCQTSGKPDSPSSQETLSCEVRVISDTSVCGYTTVRGGWNRGGPYTVYFHLETSSPISEIRKVDKGITNLAFAGEEACLEARVGISFFSEAKAEANLHASIPEWGFEAARSALVAEWDELLSRVEVSADTPDKYRRMLYTGIYHTMLMPSDRRGEWSGCGPDEPYYDDFYCLWDTYRSSMPLITLLDETRSSDIVNALLTIYRRDGYMPDGRSGNANGRTQGGSNADIVVADAFVKGVRGIDYETALQAMLHNATVAPSPEREHDHGRSALGQYLEYGYIPFGYNGAGNRTLEYAYCDFAIAEVAEGLGRREVADHYYKQSLNYRNIYDTDYRYGGMKGFVIPKDSAGNFLSEGVWVHPETGDSLDCIFTPDKSFGRGWGKYFYEANDFEMSLFAPHDILFLVDAAGGPEAFVEKLDRFFGDGCFDAGNEPSFLTPCLYHWAGRPDKTSDRVRSILLDGFDDTSSGIPGNDDSGAMSSWLVFHMMGLYPNAGQPYYVIHAPLLRSVSIHMGNGRTFTVRAPGLSDKRCHIRSVRLNGKRYDYSTIRHSDIAAGGELTLRMSRRPGRWGRGAESILTH